MVTMSSSAVGTLIARWPMPRWYLAMSVPLRRLSSVWLSARLVVLNDRS